METITKIYEGQTPAQLSRLAGVAATLVLHVVTVVAALNYEPVRSALIEATPIMVSLITSVIEKPRQQPKPPPIKAVVERPKLPEPLPLIAAVSEIPTAAAPAPPPLQPVPVEVAVPKAISAEAPAPIPPPVIPPNFNADYLDNPPPAYPAASRRLHEQGRMVLRVLVNVNGTPDKVELRTSSGSGRLDDAALDTVRRWRFVPARQGNQLVAAWVLIPITFTLKG